jgi:hypothetical protein
MIAAFATLTIESGRGDEWLTYHNGRYGTTIDYPDRFKPEPSPDSNDGRTFEADGEVVSLSLGPSIAVARCCGFAGWIASGSIPFAV